VFQCLMSGRFTNAYVFVDCISRNTISKDANNSNNFLQSRKTYLTSIVSTLNKVWIDLLHNIEREIGSNLFLNDFGG
jgi:hypothetical protein